MATSARPSTWSISEPEPHGTSGFEATLLAIAAHDLRAQLQTIKGAHEILGIGLRTKSELNLLQLGLTAVNHMTEKLNQLCDAAFLHQQGQQIKLSPVRIGPLLQQACHENEETATRKGIRIRMVPTSASIISDSLLLSAVLHNLVSNAIKYTKPGGRILLGCRRSGQSVSIEVLDTGIGITDEQMPRIFEAFTRADNTQQDGLGIGLFIVRKAIGILRHRLDVSSAGCQGSRFSVFAARAGHAAQVRSVGI